MTRLTERISETWIKVFLIKAQNSYLTGMTEAWQPVLQYSFDSTISWAGLLEMKFTFFALSWMNWMIWGNQYFPTSPQTSHLPWFPVLAAPLRWRATCDQLKSQCRHRPGRQLLKLQALNICPQVQHLLLLSGFFLLECHFIGFLFNSSFLKKKKKYNKIKNIRNQNVKLIFYKSLHGIITASFLWEGFVTSHISSLK